MGTGELAVADGAAGGLARSPPGPRRFIRLGSAGSS